MGVQPRRDHQKQDHLAYSTKPVLDFSTFKILRFVLYSIHHQLIWNTWQYKWCSLSPFYASSWHRSITSLISSSSWFWGLYLSRSQIVAFTRLCFGHNLLSNYSFHLSLSNHLLCALYIPFLIFFLYPRLDRY